MRRASAWGLALWVVLLAWSPASPVAADDSADAVTLGATYTGDLFANTTGGLRRGVTHLGTAELTVLADLHRAFGWTGAHLFLHTFTIYGGNPTTDYVGDAQYLDNIAAPTTAFELYEAWLEQELFDYHLSILVGYYDLNTEFDLSRTGMIFLNSAQGIGSTYALSGRAGPSIYPTTSFGVRIRAVPMEGTYLEAAVLDGVPGDLGSPGGAHFFDHGDGLLLAVEAGVLVGTKTRGRQPGARRRYVRRSTEAQYDAKLAFGGWVYTTSLPLVDQPGRRAGDFGVYALIDGRIVPEGASPQQGLWAFARVGAGDSTWNSYPLFIGGGLAYTGLLPGRDEDQLGLAVATAFTGSPFRAARAATGKASDEAEIAIELTYDAPVTSWLTVIGDAQYVVNPSANPALGDALAFIGRFQILDLNASTRMSEPHRPPSGATHAGANRRARSTNDARGDQLACSQRTNASWSPSSAISPSPSATERVGRSSPSRKRPAVLAVSMATMSSPTRFTSRWVRETLSSESTSDPSQRA